MFQNHTTTQGCRNQNSSQYSQRQSTRDISKSDSVTRHTIENPTLSSSANQHYAIPHSHHGCTACVIRMSESSESHLTNC
uniref:Ovule protein n=1 Tax=Schistosoma mansoni TaxID=6183 RepID=A0A5K4F842_SCHMA